MLPTTSSTASIHKSDLTNLSPNESDSVSGLNQKTQRVAFPVIQFLGEGVSYGVGCIQSIFEAIAYGVSSCVSCVNNLFTRLFFGIENEKESLAEDHEKITSLAIDSSSEEVDVKKTVKKDETQKESPFKGALQSDDLKELTDKFYALCKEIEESEVGKKIRSYFPATKEEALEKISDSLSVGYKISKAVIEEILESEKFKDLVRKGKEMGSQALHAAWEQLPNEPKFIREMRPEVLAFLLRVKKAAGIEIFEEVKEAVEQEVHKEEAKERVEDLSIKSKAEETGVGVSIAANLSEETPVISTLVNEREGSLSESVAMDPPATSIEGVESVDSLIVEANTPEPSPSLPEDVVVQNVTILTEEKETSDKEVTEAIGTPEAPKEKNEKRKWLDIAKGE